MFLEMVLPVEPARIPVMLIVPAPAFVFFRVWMVFPVIVVFDAVVLKIAITDAEVPVPTFALALVIFLIVFPAITDAVGVVTWLWYIPQKVCAVPAPLRLIFEILLLVKLGIALV